jgi:hypothetical protein
MTKPDSNISEVAQLPDSSVLLDFITGQQRSWIELLDRDSQRLTIKELFDFVVGQRGSRQMCLKQLLHTVKRRSLRGKAAAVRLPNGSEDD